MGHNRFCEMGVRTIRNVAIERLRLAAEQLPNRGDPVCLKTSKYLSNQLKMASVMLQELKKCCILLGYSILANANELEYP